MKEIIINTWDESIGHQDLVLKERVNMRELRK